MNPPADKLTAAFRRHTAADITGTAAATRLLRDAVYNGATTPYPLAVLECGADRTAGRRARADGIEVPTIETGCPASDEAAFPSYRSVGRAGFELAYARPNHEFG